MEDDTENPIWEKLTLLSEMSGLDTLSSNHCQHNESRLVRSNDGSYIKIIWRCSKNSVLVSKVTMTMFQNGTITYLVRREDKDNTLFVDRLIRNNYPGYSDLLDFNHYSHDSLDAKISAFYERLNEFFSKILIEYVCGDKWEVMEVDWGDYK